MEQVLIIGAGASGLMAANILAENNFKVTVLEARDRTGGRIHTIQSLFSLPIEAGAEFMHGKQPLTNSLLEKFGINTTSLSGNWYQVRDGQRQEGDFFDEDWERLTKALKKLDKDTDIGSFLETHFNKPADRELVEKVRGFVEGYDAADMDRASAIALREEWSSSDEEHQYHIEGGYGRLIQSLEDRMTTLGGSVLLSTTVKEIQWKKGQSTVITTTGSSFTSPKIIVTVPLGVLQHAGITFTPALPEYFEAFSVMGFGGVIKFFAEFEDAFWDNRVDRVLPGLAFVISDGEIPTWWTHRPHRNPILTGWLGGPSTQKMEADPAFLRNKAVGSLAYIFQCKTEEVERGIMRWHVENWVTDPLAMGAYAYPTTDTAQALDVVTRPVHDTIYFAGEAMYRGSAIGTVEAALVSGKDAADHIVRSFVR